jgi:hypothetical protein
MKPGKNDIPIKRKISGRQLAAATDFSVRNLNGTITMAASKRKAIPANIKREILL